MKMGDFRCLGPFLAISRRPLIWTTNYCSKLVLLRCPGAKKGDFHPFSPYFTISGPKSTFCRHFWPQECILAKKCVSGPKSDFWWFGWKKDQFGAGIHTVSSILRILVFPWCKKVNFYENSLILCYFYEKSEFYVILWFLRHVMKNNLHILPPLCSDFTYSMDILLF